MNDVAITVRGSSRLYHPAERATVFAHVGLEGGDPQTVYARVVEQAGRVHASITALHDPAHGPVTWWAAQDVRTWASRPWNKDGKQLPLVHHARTDVQVKFRDFGRLSAWLGEMAAVSGFSVVRVEWALTESRKVELVRRARTQAVTDARARAQAYADAAGLGEVRPVAIADAGMLGSGLHPHGEEAAMFSRAEASAGDGDAALALVPEDILVSAQVDARFAAAPR